jgi:hypothetical protein
MDRDKRISDREVYPALWITLAVLAGGYLVWRECLGKPALGGCWFFQVLQLYCPGCGGTRAVIALAHGHLLQSLYYHPAVMFAAASAGGYLVSQTVWRMRGRQGWVLRYSDRWLRWLLLLLAVHCAVRNLLWRGFGIPIAS